MNKKYSLPRLPDGSPFSLSRSSFLDGRNKVYFGPGQDPRVTGGYQRPTDWPAAGTLLRVPQVVWLSDYFGFFGNMRVHSTVHGPATLSNPTGIYPFTNHFAEYYLRFRTMFDEVASRVNAIRPNRTWVLNVPWLQVADYTAGWTYPPPALWGAGRHTQCLQCLAPPRGESYFGTDFLHVNLGMPATAPPGGTTQYAVPTSGAISYLSGGFVQLNDHIDGFLASDTWAGPRRDWIDARDHVMRDASAVLYSCRMDWSDLDPAIQADPNPATNLYRNFTAGVRLSDAVIRAMCDDMGEDGYSFGGYCEDATADSVVGLIAARFGFDPETGRDVG